ncbi:transposase [Chryseobacterium candidae]|uniref:transposase n=1 Tax=Chryseobacterium candidae TaxID=1978493 RepID=UPI0021CFE185|nr:transposase [Chryseobacterium candidae]
MTGSIKRISKCFFPHAVQVIDRFHVQKLAIKPLKELRIKHHWEAIEIKNSFEGQSLDTEVFENGDSRKQLSAL